MNQPKLTVSAAESAAAAFDFQHPLDASSQCKMATLSRIAGLTEVAVNLVTIAPGQQGFPHHTHHGEEEWVFVVSGDADVRLGEEHHALGAGDFVAFPSGGPAHSVRNSGSADLVCLMGGHRVPAKIIDCPELGKRVTFTDEGFAVADMSAFRPFEPPRPKGSGS